MLSALADGPLPFSPLWRRMSRVPLEGDAGAFAAWRLALTALGRDVLARRRDWLALHPFRRCLGGVHLHPEGTAWRWDAARGRLGGDAR